MFFMASIYSVGQESEDESLSKAICQEFSDQDGKTRINTEEKGKKLGEMLRSRGYRPIADTAIEEMLPENEPLNRGRQA